MSAVHGALLAVMREVDYIHKESRVESGRISYSFAGESHFLRLVRPALLRHGLVFYPVDVFIQTSVDEVPSKYGPRVERSTKVVVQWNLVHVESGESLRVASAGEGCDGGDKATPKAMTIALKYALRQALLIETGDDPDRERPEHVAERKAEALFESQRRAVGELLRSVGRGSKAEANELIQQISDGTLSLADVKTQPGAVLAVLHEWRELQAGEAT